MARAASDVVELLPKVGVVRVVRKVLLLLRLLLLPYSFPCCCYCCCLPGVRVDHDADGGDGGVNMREAEHDLLVVARSRAGALVAAVADRAV